MTNVFIISAPSGSGQVHAGAAGCCSVTRSSCFQCPTRPDAPRGAESPGERATTSSPGKRSRTGLREASSWNGPRFSATTTGRTAASLDRAVAEGRDLVLDIDVQGARQLKEAIPDAVSIFILAPSREILEQAPEKPVGRRRELSFRSGSERRPRDPELHQLRLRAGE